MSSKAECPACKAHLSAIWDILNPDWHDGDKACPSCGLPGSVIRQIEDARKKHADADLTRRLEEALIRAGKAEARLQEMYQRMSAVRLVFAEWERDEPVMSDAWRPWQDWPQ